MEIVIVSASQPYMAQLVAMQGTCSPCPTREYREYPVLPEGCEVSEQARRGLASLARLRDCGNFVQCFMLYATWGRRVTKRALHPRNTDKD